MSTTWKTVRVFISSTFRDMQAERDHLVRFVFPRLRERLLPRRIHLVDVDLRWGVTSDQDASEVCREIITECRPRFLCMLGGRYGTIPEGRELSITGDEIHFGVIDADREELYALFYLRHGAVTERMDTTTPGSVRELRHSDKARKLAKLKRDMRAAHCKPFLYRPCWNADERLLLDLKAFGDRVERDILATIDDEFGTNAAVPLDEFADENAAMEAFVEDRCQRFVLGSRERVLNELIAHVNATGGNGYACLFGASGSGKSALLANLYRHLLTENRQPRIEIPPLVIPHFVGASAGSTDVRRTMQRFCHELKRSCPEITLEIPGDYEKLRTAFPDFLRQACAKKRVVILIDAVNQFDFTLHFGGMYWLPEELPANARIILSSLDMYALEELRRGRLKPKEFELKPLTALDGEAIIEQFRRRYHKQFTSDQQDALLAKREAGTPLYLLAALEELRTLGTYEEISQRITELPPTTMKLSGWILKRLERDPGFRDEAGRQVGRELVSRFGTLLCCSRHGLSQAEMTDLLDRNDPRGNIAALMRFLRPYLMHRGSLIDFYHDYFRSAAEQAYLQGNEQRLSAHADLAQYFRSKADPQHNHTWDGTYTSPMHEVIHSLDEVVYHMYEANNFPETLALARDCRFLKAQLHLASAGTNAVSATLDFALLAACRLEQPLSIVERTFAKCDHFCEISSENPVDMLTHGGLEAAWQVCSICPEKMRVTSFLILALELRAQGRRLESEATLNRLVQLVPLPISSSTCKEEVCVITNLLGYVTDPLHRNQNDLWARILPEVHYEDLAQTLIGQRRFDQALSVTERVADPKIKARLLSLLLDRLAAPENATICRGLLSLVETVCLTLLEPGLFDGLYSIRSLDGPYVSRDELFQTIIGFHLANHLPDEAIRATGSIVKRDAQLWSLARIARSLLRTGDREGSSKALSVADGVVQVLKDTRVESDTLDPSAWTARAQSEVLDSSTFGPCAEIAALYGQVGNLEHGRLIAYRLKRALETGCVEHAEEECAIILAFTLARLGLFDDACQVAKNSDTFVLRARIVSSLAKFSVRLDDKHLNAAAPVSRLVQECYSHLLCEVQTCRELAEKDDMTGARDQADAVKRLREALDPVACMLRMILSLFNHDDTEAALEVTAECANQLHIGSKEQAAEVAVTYARLAWLVGRFGQTERSQEFFEQARRFAAEIPVGHWENVNVETHSRGEPDEHFSTRFYRDADIKPNTYLKIARLAIRRGQRRLANELFREVIGPVVHAIESLSDALSCLLRACSIMALHGEHGLAKEGLKEACWLTTMYRTHDDRDRQLAEIGKRFIGIGSLEHAAFLTTVVRASVGHDSTKLVEELLRAQAHKGDLLGATETIEREPVGYDRDNHWAFFATCLAECNQCGLARDALFRIGSASTRAKVILAIAAKHWESGRLKDVSDTVRLLLCGGRVGGLLPEYISALSDLAVVANEAGDRSLASAVLGDCLEFVVRSSSPENNWPLNKLVECCANARDYGLVNRALSLVPDSDRSAEYTTTAVVALRNGDIAVGTLYCEEALKRLQHSKSEILSDWDYGKLAAAMAEHGLAEMAKAVGGKLASDNCKASVYGGICKGLTARGCFAEALDVSVFIHDQAQRVEILADMAKLCVDQSRPQLAAEALISAMKVTRLLRRQEDYKRSANRARAVGSLAEALWQSGRQRQARRLYDKARNLIQYGDSVCDMQAEYASDAILKSQVNVGDLDGALENCRGADRISANLFLAS